MVARAKRDARRAQQEPYAVSKSGRSAITVVCGSSQWVVLRRCHELSPILVNTIDNEVCLPHVLSHGSVTELMSEKALTVSEDEDVFQFVLSFVQSRRYQAPVGDVLLHMRVYCLAIRYKVQSLIDQARDRFNED